MKEITINDKSWLSYACGQGRFFTFDKLTKDIGNLYTCRVEFAWRFKYPNQTWIGYYASNANISAFSNFFDEVETRLGFKTKSKIFKIAPKSDHKNIGFVIHLRTFWTKNDTNRSLVTLLMRCFASYAGSNLNESFNNYPLAYKCKLAIEFFLDGYTEPTYEILDKRDMEGYPGFVARFENCDANRIKQLLKKP